MTSNINEESKTKNSDNILNNNINKHQKNMREDINHKKTELAENEKILLEKLKEKFKITKIKFLGQGGYGRVFEIVIESRRYAIKFLHYEKLTDRSDEKTNEKYKKMINNELYFSMMLNYRYCLKGINKLNFPEEKIVVLFTVYCENSDMHFLKNLFHSKKIFKNIEIGKIHKIKKTGGTIDKEISDNNIIKNESLANPTEIFLKYFIQQLLLGLKYLNNCGLIHCDLKLKNIFLTKDFSIKIGDYGTIKRKKDYNEILNISTQISQAPEFIFELNQKITYENVTKLDIYSLGCICYNFLFNKHLIDSEEIDNFIKNGYSKKNKEEAVFNFYFEKYRKQIIENEELKKYQKLKDFLKGLLNPKIEERFDIDTAFNHPWMNEYNNFQYYVEMNDNDSIKFLLELQKIEYSEYMKEKLNINIFKEIDETNEKLKCQMDKNYSQENIQFEIIDIYE